MTQPSDNTNKSRWPVVVAVLVLLGIASPSVAQEIRTLKGHEGAVMSVAFSPDGKTLASESVDGTIKLWNCQSGKLIITMYSYAPVGNLVYSPDGTTIVSIEGVRIEIWDVKTAKQRDEIIAYRGFLTDGVISLNISPDGKSLFSGGFCRRDDEVKQWDVNTLRQVEKKFQIGRRDAEFGIVDFTALSRDGSILAAGDPLDGVVVLWDSETGKQIRTLQHLAYSASFSHVGSTLATGGESEIRLWNAKTGKNTVTVASPNSGNYSVSFSPNDKVISAITRSDGIYLWDVTTGKVAMTLQGHKQPVRSVAFSPDGKMLASGSKDKTIKLWDISKLSN